MIALIDFETTGLLKDGNPDFLVQPGITQIGAVKYDLKLRKVTGEYTTFVNPELPESRWEAGAIKTTGITPAHVANAPTFFAVFDEFAAFVEGCDTWSGYHTNFDKTVLWHQLLRYGFERAFPWPRRELDVMKLAGDHMAMEGKRGGKRPKLVEIYHHLFKEDFDAHDALEDIKATARVLGHLSKEK